MKNIVLIGMPASGKSTVGVILAKTLGIGFVDTDLVIQQRENALLQDIINEKGLQCFLDKERDAILSLECERLPLYKKYADITVDTADLSPEETVSRIIFSLKN